MKKIVLLMLLILSVNIVSTTSFFGYELSNDKEYLYYHIVDSDNYLYEDENYLIIGNNHDIKTEEIKYFQDNNINKILLIYFFDDYKGNIKSYEDMKAIKYYRVMGKTKTAFLGTYSTDKTIIRDEIYEFFLEDLNSYSQDYVNILSFNDAQSNTFESFPNYSGILRYNQKPYGYFVINYNVSKFRVNEISSLWLINSSASFTPGYIAVRNNESGYEKYKNGKGYLHVEATQPKHEISQSYTYPGGKPYFKDAYPVNQPGKVTITSSFSTGLTLGYSFENGFSTDGSSTSHEINVGLNIGYSYSKSFTHQNPRMSSQNSPTINNEYQWSYRYAETHGAIETNHIKTGYIYEQNNSGPDHYLDENDISFKYEMDMDVHKQFTLFHNTKNVNKSFYVGFHP